MEQVHMTAWILGVVTSSTDKRDAADRRMFSSYELDPPSITIPALYYPFTKKKSKTFSVNKKQMSSFWVKLRLIVKRSLKLWLVTHKKNNYKCFENLTFKLTDDVFPYFVNSIFQASSAAKKVWEAIIIIASSLTISFYR